MVPVALLGMVSGRKLRAVRRLSVSGHLPDAELLTKLQVPVLKLSMILRTAFVVGILLLMTAKPELRESLEVIGALAILGSVCGLFFFKAQKEHQFWHFL